MPEWKMGDLRTKKVPKRKGDLLPMGKSRVMELSHDQSIWEVQKLGNYAGKIKWVTDHYSLEDPNKVWAKEEELASARRTLEHQRMLAMVSRHDEEEAKLLQEAVKEERKRLNSWYNRLWRAIGKPRSTLPTAKVEKE